MSNVARAMLHRPATERSEAVIAGEVFGKILHGLNHVDRRRFFQRLRYRQQQQLVQLGMAGWLGEQFTEQSTAFLTTTFAPVLWLDQGGHVVGKRPQDKSGFCCRVLQRAVHLLNEHYFGRRYWKRKHLRIYEAWEFQKCGALHAHLLVGNLPVGHGPPFKGKVPQFWSYADFHGAWRGAQQQFNLTPGRAWVVPYTKGELMDYVCKYVTKDQRGDLWSYHHGAPGEGRTRATGEKQPPQLKHRPGQSLGRFNNGEARHS